MLTTQQQKGMEGFEEITDMSKKVKQKIDTLKKIDKTLRSIQPAIKSINITGKEKELWVGDVQKEVEKKQKEEKKIKKSYILKAVFDVLTYTPPEGLFTKDAETIAKRLKQDSEDLKQAMSRLNFYINRAGTNLTQERSKELEKAKDVLRDLFVASK